MPDLDLSDEQLFQWLFIVPITIFAIVFLSVVFRWLAHKIIDRMVLRPQRERLMFKMDKAAAVLAPFQAENSERREQRGRAMSSLLKSIVSVLVGATALIMVLDVMGLPIAPLLASAGVLGLAIGFGAQSVVKDFLAGIAMILEDQYGVDDVVEIGDVIGTVESVGMRVTRVRDAMGTVWYVRNGEILRVGNHSQNWTRSTLDITVPKDANVDTAMQLFGSVVSSIAADSELGSSFVRPPTMIGLDSFDANGIVLRVRFVTKPSAQFSVARALQERVLAQFAREGIDLVSSKLTTAGGE